jgi:hypothetical protein
MHYWNSSLIYCLLLTLLSIFLLLSLILSKYSGKEEKERKRDYFTKRVKRLTEIKHNSEGLYRE